VARPRLIGDRRGSPSAAFLDMFLPCGMFQNRHSAGAGRHIKCGCHLRRIGIIATIKREGGILCDPARFVMAARRAATNGPVCSDLMFAWTAEKVITSMAVAGVPDDSSALAAALNVLSDALRDPGASAPRDQEIRRA